MKSKLTRIIMTVLGFLILFSYSYLAFFQEAFKYREIKLIEMIGIVILLVLGYLFKRLHFYCLLIIYVYSIYVIFLWCTAVI